MTDVLLNTCFISTILFSFFLTIDVCFLSSNRDLRATAHANQHDNSVDAVLAAGGLDQLLLPARALIRGGSLISDNHSAFSHGSMSSLRSNGKKSPKTRQ